MHFSEADIDRLNAMAKRMRLTALDMALSAGQKGAHLGGSLSCIEIYAALYGAVLNLDVKNPSRNLRDRMIAGKEHARLAEFPAMAEAGLISREDLFSFEMNNGLLAGHPRNLNIGLEYSCCSLGMALPFAVGKAVLAKQQNSPYKIYVLLGDGECYEGSVWEAMMFAAHNKLDNLVIVIDRNMLSADGNTETVLALENLEDKLKSFGCDVMTVDGHNIGELLKSFSHKAEGKPYALIAKTVKGKGVSFMENKKEWHQNILTEELYKKAYEEVGGGE